MRRILAATVTTVAVSLGALTLATPANAAVTLTALTLSASTVVVDGDAGCGDRVKVTVTVRYPAAEAEDFWGVTAQAFAPNGDSADYLLMPLVTSSGDLHSYSDWVFLCGYEAPGKYRLHTEIDWWDDAVGQERRIVRDATFYLKRPTSLTYDATPEPVRRGIFVTHKGRLMVDPNAAGPKVGLSGASITFYFRKNGTTAWVKKASVLTGKGGNYAKGIAAYEAGTWKAAYGGGTTRQPQERMDPVAIKK